MIDDDQRATPSTARPPHELRYTRDEWDSMSIEVSYPLAIPDYASTFDEADAPWLIAHGCICSLHEIEILPELNGPRIPAAINPTLTFYAPDGVPFSREDVRYEIAITSTDYLATDNDAVERYTVTSDDKEWRITVHILDGFLHGLTVYPGITPDVGGHDHHLSGSVATQP